MNPIDDITIERYLDGSMDAAEQAAFQARMADDAMLRRRVSSEESMIRALRADRDRVRRDHGDVRSRVLGSIPQIAPADGTQITTARRSVGSRLRWPTIGTVLVIAGWIALDLFTTDPNPAIPTIPARQLPAATVPAAAPSSSASEPSSSPVAKRRAETNTATRQSATSRSTSKMAPTRAVTKPAPATGSPRATAGRAEPSPETASEAPATNDAAKTPLPRRIDNVAKTSVDVNRK